VTEQAELAIRIREALEDRPETFISLFEDIFGETVQATHNPPIEGALVPMDGSAVNVRYMIDTMRAEVIPSRNAGLPLLRCRRVHARRRNPL
jgi:hypothetical protein